ncbi:MAG: putative 2-aminoethylphosphonate ABC transporter substrate-binding protein [Phenylobacterium zucineum]|nr:MAG: putative 2-aminoethylphosphonate ABC transporter substrate-binding protein [Phenylobacterium zucineum]
MSPGRIVGLVLLLALAGCSKRDALVVYTAAEADQLDKYERAFSRAHPDIDLVWVRDSTGVLTAKLLAERKAPRADAIFALAATSMAQVDSAGGLAPYRPRNLDRIEARFRDPRAMPHWTGTAVLTAAICVNTIETRKRGLPIPKTWEDLADPIYRGAISMPNPASSGVGLLMVAGWLQGLGEADAWAFMDRLDQNVVSYAHSGSKPCKDAARGEVPIGISFDFRAVKTQSEGAPIVIVVPPRMVGWDMETAGVVAGARHPEAARAFVDWATSDEAMALYAQSFAIVGVPDVAKPSPSLPTDLAERLAPMDVAWTAKNRMRVLSEWVRRYEGRLARS